MKSQTERLLTAPVLPVLARLSAPGLLLVAFQSAVSIGDTYFVGRLGTGALAGLALVFPLVMLLQMTSAGAMGGGVAAAISRALGAGDARSARRLVVHALVIAAAMGLAFTVLVLAFGPGLYRLLGGHDDSLHHALAYSNILFAGAIVVWAANTLSSVLRGAGNMALPAGALIAAATLQVPLSAGLVLGLGPLPRLGIAGAAVAYVGAFGFSTLVMAGVVFRRASPLRPAADDWRLEWRLFREILRVGALSVLNSLQTVFTAVVLTGFVGRHGAAAIAGYGVGLRLELLQIPIVFAIGQALVVLVGTNLGAGQGERARSIAWAGAGLAAAISLAIGIVVTCFPLAWVGLFSADAAVLESGGRYLRTVAPCYPFLAAGIALYFASQGAGSVLQPFLAGTARLAIVLAGGVLVASLQGLFVVVAAATAAYGGLTMWFLAHRRWH
ncbi:MAG TPA: MATE family efflux transporter [Burkholderiales bacterium]